jgi:hypothetical protein
MRRNLSLAAASRGGLAAVPLSPATSSEQTRGIFILFLQGPITTSLIYASLRNDLRLLSHS